MPSSQRKILIVSFFFRDRKAGRGLGLTLVARFGGRVGATAAESRRDSDLGGNHLDGLVGVSDPERVGDLLVYLGFGYGLAGDVLVLVVGLGRHFGSVMSGRTGLRLRSRDIQ